jgi:aryl-alcohol dehydrogenase-like predicted oxidoreductase
MDMRKLGRDGPEISVIGYGAWEAGGDFWGPNESDQRVIGAIRAGIDAGMTWVDTAEIYGLGRSEELVGQALDGRRDEVLLFTKVAPEGPGTGFRPDQVRRAIRASLERLRTDHVDLYQLHWPDDSIPVEETWGALAGVVEEGLARHVGVSNFGRDLVERCEAIRHVDSVQNEFSLLHQDDRGQYLAWLSASGTGYLAYSPLAMGMLSGAIGKDHRFDPRDFRSGSRGQSPEYFRPGNLEANVDRVERLRRVAEQVGAPVGTAALRWVVEQDGVTAAIAGSRNPDHVRSNAAAGDQRLSESMLEEIDAIFS